MYKFWESIIEPFLRTLHPKHIVEIGTEYGKQTKHLLQYALEHGIRLTSIDPIPMHPREWETQYSCFTFIEDTSLTVLPTLQSYDCVLIDGDHNWYTVYHELRYIEQYMLNTDQSVCILLHDTGWPYGRRDLYYKPDRIPSIYRHHHARGGLLVHQDTPVENRGWNHQSIHSLHEGGYRNGVLTALEDFLRQSSITWLHGNVSGLHGLSILVPRLLSDRQHSIAEFLSKISLSDPIRTHLDILEQQYLEECHADSVSCHEKQQDTLDKLECCTRNLHDTKAHLNRVMSQWNLARHGTTILQDNIAMLEKQYQDAKNEIHHLTQLRSFRWMAPLRKAEAWLRLLLRK